MQIWKTILNTRGTTVISAPEIVEILGIKKQYSDTVVTYMVDTEPTEKPETVVITAIGTGVDFDLDEVGNPIDSAYVCDEKFGITFFAKWIFDEDEEEVDEEEYNCDCGCEEDTTMEEKNDSTEKSILKSISELLNINEENLDKLTQLLPLDSFTDKDNSTLNVDSLFSGLMKDNLKQKVEQPPKEDSVNTSSLDQYLAQIFNKFDTPSPKKEVDLNKKIQLTITAEDNAEILDSYGNSYPIPKGSQIFLEMSYNQYLNFDVSKIGKNLTVSVNE